MSSIIWKIGLLYNFSYRQIIIKTFAFNSFSIQSEKLAIVEHIGAS